jgi:hypothetical protein
MMLAYLWLQASQERSHELVEAVYGNPDDAALCAQPAQVVHDLEAAMTAMQALEVERGFVAPSPPTAP